MALGEGDLTAILAEFRAEPPTPTLPDGVDELLVVDLAPKVGGGRAPRRFVAEGDKTSEYRAKRARNTEYARRSRARAKELQKQRDVELVMLRERVARLEALLCEAGIPC